MLTRESIFNTPDPQPRKITVGEWGGDVYVKVMSGAERAAWEELAFVDDKAVTRDVFRATVVVKTVCNQDGTLLFDESDIEQLAAKPAPPIVRLARIAMKINRLRGEDVDDDTKN